MISTIKKMILGIMKWAAANENSNSINAEINYPVAKSASLDSDAGITFRLYNAVGGYIVETISYDRATDRRNTKLYIITSEDNFGDEIAHIITREKLSQ